MEFRLTEAIDLTRGVSFARQFETDANPGARPTVAMATGGGFPQPLLIVMDILSLTLLYPAKRSCDPPATVFVGQRTNKHRSRSPSNFKYVTLYRCTLH